MSGLHAFMNINISLHIEANIAYLQTLLPWSFQMAQVLMPESETNKINTRTKK